MDAYDRALDKLETVALPVGVHEIRIMPEMRIRRGIRRELIKAGMKERYANLLAMRTPVTIDVELNEDQIDRLIAVAEHIANVVYLAHAGVGFDDESIAEAYDQLAVNFG